MKLKVIKTRRSVRKYSNKKIPDEIIKTILEAAMYTPTTFDLSPFKIVVVEKGAVKELNKIVNYQEHALIASHNFFIFGYRKNKVDANYLSSLFPPGSNESVKKLVEFYRGENYDFSGSVHAVSITVTLEAKANGIDTTIFSGFNKKAGEEYFKKYLDVSKYELVLGISLGFKDGDGDIRERNVPSISDKVIFIKK